MPVITAPQAACGRCSYFDASAGASLGTCRFNPPSSTADAKAAWPKVESKDWCGHFAAEAAE